MRKEKHFEAYDFDYLEEGSKIKLEHTVYLNPNDADLLPFVQCSTKELQSLRKLSVAREQETFYELKKVAAVWEQRASETMLIDRAIEYLKTPEIEHTENKWVKDRYADEKISNRVYQMSVNVYEDSTYDRQTQQCIPTAWYVTWDVGVHTPKHGWGKAIAVQRQKRYTDKDAALKYIEGRKKAYAHLFTEISPPIPQEYAEHFKVNGVLLPGYTIEGQEPITTNRTAIEVLNELSGGAFALQDKKPSVLGKLAASKEDMKKAPSGGAKKKEEPAL